VIKEVDGVFHNTVTYIAVVAENYKLMKLLRISKDNNFDNS